MGREIFTEEHEAFREMVRSFIDKEIAPFHQQWEKDGVVSRDVWLAAGRQGLLGIEERVTHLGGSFAVESDPGAGAMLRVILPVAA